VGLIGASIRLNVLLGFYLMALFMMIAVLAGSLYIALFFIVCSEILLTWRPVPKLGPASYVGPTPPSSWQGGIRFFRWFELLRSYWSLAVGAVVFTLFIGFFIIEVSPPTLGTANYAVGAIIAGWLVTRPVWYPVLRKAIGQSLQGVKKQVATNAAAVVVGAEGIDVVQKVSVIGGPARGPWDFHVGFAEIDELRMLSPMEAQTYWQTMEQYDPTLTVRAAMELYRYLKGELPRPSIYQWVSAAAHLLIRGPSVLYLLAFADESGPAAITAWQAWRAAHATPAIPSA
jgi:hypothetical protein